MAYSLAAAGAVVTGTTSVSPTFGRSPVANDLLSAQVVFNGTLPATPSGWALDEGSSTDSSAIFHKIAAGGDSAPTFSSSTSTFMAAVLAEWTGNATTSPLDQHAGGTSTTSPLSIANVLADSVSGDLILSAVFDTLSKAQAPTTTDTFNNGATATDLGNNDSTSTTHHYRFSYGITTGNSVTDNLSHTDSSSRLTASNGSIASFKPGAVAHALAGEAGVAQSLVSGSVGQTQALSGELGVAGSSVAGTPKLSIALGGQAGVASSSLAGALGQTQALSGEAGIAHSSLGAATLNVNPHHLAGEGGVAQSLLSGVLGQTQALSGSSTSSSRLSASLSVSLPLGGEAGVADSALSGTLGQTQALSGSTSASSLFAASLLLTIALAGQLTSASSLAGTLTLASVLGGNLSAASRLSGSLYQAHAFGGEAGVAASSLGPATLSVSGGVSSAPTRALLGVGS